jgi:DNA (cytosine-5)-methyltransferase 1
MRFRLGELFCGPGGLGYAATGARLSVGGAEFAIEHAWANDWDEGACRTYARNVVGDVSAVLSVAEFRRRGASPVRGAASEPPRSVLCGDVRELPLALLPPIDALTFGFPCNDYSIVGEQKGLEGEYGPLYTYGVRVLDRHRPRWFLAENVGGLQSANEGRAFAEIISRLQTAGPGYALTVHLYRFEQYGVPQTRARIVIVGIARPLGLTFRVPAPTTPRQPRTAREALECPPVPPDAANHEATRQSAEVVERLKHIPPGENAWYEGIPERLKLNVKGATLSQIYRRLDPDKPSYTITGSGGGGTHGYHWSEPRALTNRERARLQTFPDSFVFEGSKESVRKQIGMAVPPRGARVIFEAILKTFAGVPYASVAPRWDVEPGPEEGGRGVHQLSLLDDSEE